MVEMSRAENRPLFGTSNEEDLRQKLGDDC